MTTFAETHRKRVGLSDIAAQLMRIEVVESREPEFDKKTHRWCNYGQHVVLLSAFNSKNGGEQAYCRECMKEYSRNYYTRTARAV